MKGYDDAFNFVVGAEGGYTKSEHDRGNWTTGTIGRGELKGTKYGISAMSYPHLDIENLTLDDAKGIYYSDYWLPMWCDKVGYPKALCMFDAAVNNGITNSTRFAQRAASVYDDGKMGPITLSAIQQMDAGLFVEYALQSRRIFYQALSTFSRYGRGWLNRLDAVRREANA